VGQAELIFPFVACVPLDPQPKRFSRAGYEKVDTGFSLKFRSNLLKSLTVHAFRSNRPEGIVM
jgi:hypothetical protein